MSFNKDVRLDTSQVSDRRGASAGTIAALGGGGTVLLLVITLLYNAMGGQGDPMGDLVNLAGSTSGASADLSHCKTGADANLYPLETMTRTPGLISLSCANNSGPLIRGITMSATTRSISFPCSR